MLKFATCYRALKMLDLPRQILYKSQVRKFAIVKCRNFVNFLSTEFLDTFEETKEQELVGHF